MDTDLTGGALSWQNSVGESSAAESIRGYIRSILNPSINEDVFQLDLNALLVDESSTTDSQYVIDPKTLLNKGLTSDRGSTKLKNSELLSSEEKLQLATIAKTLKLMTGTTLTRANLLFAQKQATLRGVSKQAFLDQFAIQYPIAQREALEEVTRASRANTGPLAAIQNAIGTVLPTSSPKKRLQEAVALAGVPRQIVLDELEEKRGETGQLLVGEQREVLQERIQVEQEAVAAARLAEAAEREQQAAALAREQEAQSRLAEAARSFSEAQNASLLENADNQSVASRRSSISSVGSRRSSVSTVGPRSVRTLARIGAAPTEESRRRRDEEERQYHDELVRVGVIPAGTPFLEAAAPVTRVQAVEERAEALEAVVAAQEAVATQALGDRADALEAVAAAQDAVATQEEIAAEVQTRTNAEEINQAAAFRVDAVEAAVARGEDEAAAEVRGEEEEAAQIALAAEETRIQRAQEISRESAEERELRLLRGAQTLREAAAQSALQELARETRVGSSGVSVDEASRLRIEALEAENQELRQFRESASREMEALQARHVADTQELRLELAKTKEALEEQSERRLHFESKLLTVPDPEAYTSRIRVLEEENERLTQQVQTLALPLLPSFVGVNEAQTPERGNASLFLSPEPAGNLDISSTSVLTPSGLLREAGEVASLPVNVSLDAASSLVSPIVEIVGDALEVGITPVRNLLPSIPGAPSFRRSLQRVSSSLRSPQAPSALQLEELQAFAPTRQLSRAPQVPQVVPLQPEQVRSAISTAVAQAQAAAALATSAVRSRTAASPVSAALPVDSDVERIAQASGGDENLIEILDLTARALNITGPRLRKDQLENLRERLQIAYNLDRGQTLQKFGRKLFGEAGKNFFLSSNLATDGVAFLTPNMQRRFLLKYQNLPLEDSYEADLDINFHYTQAGFD